MNYYVTQPYEMQGRDKRRTLVQVADAPRWRSHRRARQAATPAEWVFASVSRMEAPREMQRRPWARRPTSCEAAHARAGCGRAEAAGAPLQSLTGCYIG